MKRVTRVQGSCSLPTQVRDCRSKDRRRFAAEEKATHEGLDALVAVRPPSLKTLTLLEIALGTQTGAGKNLELGVRPG